MLLHFKFPWIFILNLSFTACDKQPKEATINGIALDKYTS
jgi:hypothetical protein